METRLDYRTFWRGVLESHPELERWISSWKYLLLLQRTPVWVPAPTRWLTTIFNSRSRGSNVLFWPSQSPAMHGKHIYKYRQKTHICLSLWIIMALINITFVVSQMVQFIHPATSSFIMLSEKGQWKALWGSLSCTNQARILGGANVLWNQLQEKIK